MQSYSHEILSEPKEKSAPASPVLEKADARRWYDILQEFEDATIFQTPAFCNAKQAGESVEHVTLRRGGEVIAAAQVRIIPVPLLPRSIAYVFWGPLIHRRNGRRDWDCLRIALGHMYREYVISRRMCLRVKPPTMLDGDAAWREVLEAECYYASPHLAAGKTILVDLAPSLDDLRKGLDKKWRNCLKSSESNGLSLDEGSDDAMFEVFLTMYREMLHRKNLAEPGDIRRFHAMQSILPSRHRMRVFVARDEQGTPCAGAICSAIGSRGIFLFGATADQGMKNKASYLVQWRIVQWLKQQGCSEYDLHGSNAEANPGVYAFKMGLCGKNGREVAALGSYEAYENSTDRVLLQSIDCANAALKKLKSFYEKRRGFRG